jgi:hypothetical protein
MIACAIALVGFSVYVTMSSLRSRVLIPLSRKGRGNILIRD